MEIGNRVIIIHSGEVGHIESIDDDWCDVRLLTPKNVPSCVVTTCRLKNVIQVSDSVLPMPRSKEWFREARMFLEQVEVALIDID